MAQLHQLRTTVVQVTIVNQALSYQHHVLSVLTQLTQTTRFKATVLNVLLVSTVTAEGCLRPKQIARQATTVQQGQTQPTRKDVLKVTTVLLVPQRRLLVWQDLINPTQCKRLVSSANQDFTVPAPA